MTKTDPIPSTRAIGYHEALGQFIESFAMVEGFMQMLLWHYAKVSPIVGKAVFSGVRTDVASSHIRRIISVNDPGEPLRNDLDDILTQLSAINTIRNAIVHHVPLSGLPGDVRHLTNEITALTDQHRKETAVSTKMLKDMTADLLKIAVHIGYQMSFARASKLTLAMFDEWRRAPWRYRPQPLNPNQKNPGGKAGKRLRLHGPSRR
jgi:hypothetical protein